MFRSWMLLMLCADLFGQLPREPPIKIGPGGPYGSVAGTLVDNKGAAQQGARVDLIRIPLVLKASTPSDPSFRFGPSFRMQLTTDSAGAFRSDQVPVGRYYVCAAQVGAYLPPNCNWGRRSIPIQVREKEVTSGVQVQLNLGLLLTLRIREGKARLPKADSGRIGVVLASGAFKPATAVVSSGPDQDFRILIPREAAYIVVRDPYRLTNMAGAQIATNGRGTAVAFGPENEQLIEFVALPASAKPPSCHSVNVEKKGDS